MSRRARLLAVVVALLLPGIATARFVAGRSGGETPLSLRHLPAQVAGWEATEQTRLTPEELEVLAPDDYVSRRYEAPDRAAIELYVSLYAEQSSHGNGAHDPAVCYPAQGWEVIATRPIEVGVSGGERFAATLLTAHYGPAEQRVIYWFQPAERWPARQLREQLTRVWDALAGRPQYAFVRLAAAAGVDENPERDLLEFAGEIARPVRDALRAGD